MKRSILAFAQARNDFGFSEHFVEADDVETLKGILERVAPGISLAGLRVAVDCEFSDWDASIGKGSEIALIPPVSGG